MAESAATKPFGRFKDISGQVFGRWTAIRPVERLPRYRIAWECVCECGVIKAVSNESLRKGESKSCGCLRRELTEKFSRERVRKPVHSSFCAEISSEYSALMNAISRCTNPANKNYRRYGARGIFVCKRWRFGVVGKTGFDCFLSDMGRKPSPDLTLDRIDNSGPYAPENCRWASWKTQANNRG